MRSTGKILAAAAVVALSSGSALAADVVILPPPAPPAPAPIADPAFTGPYWGVFGGVLGGPNAQGPGPNIGTQFGYNFGSGGLRVGFEIETENDRNIAAVRVEGYLSARLGFVLNNSMMIYGQGGIGTLGGNPARHFGLGVEVALNSGLALFAEAKVIRLPFAGPQTFFVFRGGVNYYADPSNLDAAGAFDWGGMYFGVVADNFYPVGAPPNVGQRETGVQVGYNFAGGGPLLWGFEVVTDHFNLPLAQVSAEFNGRAGFTFGNVLVYGEAGVGTILLTPYWNFGGGVEFALGNRLSLFGEFKRLIDMTGGASQNQILGGVNIHFGR